MVRTYVKNKFPNKLDILYKKKLIHLMQKRDSNSNSPTAFVSHIVFNFTRSLLILI